MFNEQLLHEFQVLEDAFNKALTTNNIAEISKHLSNDWVILEPQYGLVNKERFLNAIQTGDLSHTSMQKNVVQVKLHDDIALVTTRGMNVGFYKNVPFDSEQWVTNIYKNANGIWKCVMTHESPVSCD
jgi:ketosteroid isomerase-like protein